MLWFLIGRFKHFQSSQSNKFAISLQYLKKELRYEVDFLHADNDQSSLQIDFNTLSIKVSCKVILSLLMGMIKHSQNTLTSLQYLKKEIRNGVHFLHADKHQSFYKLALLILMEVTRYVQSTQNSKAVTFLQYLKKKVLQLLLFSSVMQNIQIFYGGPVMLVVAYYLTYPNQKYHTYFQWVMEIWFLHLAQYLLANLLQLTMFACPRVDLKSIQHL